jgi:hypothetical protein
MGTGEARSAVGERLLLRALVLALARLSASEVSDRHCRCQHNANNDNRIANNANKIGNAESSWMLELTGSKCQQRQQDRHRRILMDVRI